MIAVMHYNHVLCGAMSQSALLLHWTRRCVLCSLESALIGDSIVKQSPQLSHLGKSDLDKYPYMLSVYCCRGINDSRSVFQELFSNCLDSSSTPCASC